MKRRLNHFLLFLFCLGFINNTAFAQTLAAGDIAIIGVNTDGPTSSTDEFSIVTLASIASGTTIYFSDYYWNNTNLYWGNNGLNGTIENQTEGIIKWTTTSAIAAGTVFKISWTMGSGTPSVSGLPGTLTVASGQTGFTSSGPLGSGSDNIFIYQSNNNGVTPSNWIFGWTNGLSTNASCNNCWQSSSTTILGTNSMLPTALTNGTNAISFAQVGSGSSSNPSFDNNVYNIGSLRLGDKTAILSAICTTSNWIGNETTAYDIAPTSSYFSGTNTFVLPVELMSFNVKHIQSGNLLTWATASENQNKGFDVEAATSPNPSKGGEFVWRKIGFVKGNGTTTKRQDYSFTHDLSSLPFGEGQGGVVYYRLRQLDFDGSFEYSKIIVVENKKSSSIINVYPNPSNDIFNVIAKEEDIETVRLLNSFGQTIYVNIQNNQIDLSQQPEGMYYLQVAGQNIKLVKN